jgi:hypothetical protein
MAPDQPEKDQSTPAVVDYQSVNSGTIMPLRRFSFGNCSIVVAVVVVSAASSLLLPHPWLGSYANNIVIEYLLILAGIGEVFALVGLFERGRQHVALLGALLCLAEAVLLPALVTA